MSALTFQRHHSFASYWEFETFDTKLSQQLATGQAVEISVANAVTLSFQAQAYYQLPGSAQVWALSSPDNAWRGYFLPLEEAQAYQHKLHQRDRRTRLGFLAILIIGILIFSWVQVNQFLAGLPPTSP